MEALKRRVGIIFCAVSIVAMVLPPHGVSATNGKSYTVLPKPTTYWQDPSALLISAYQRDATGHDIAVVEVYNDSNAPITITDWVITGTFRVGSAEVKTNMLIEAKATGMLEPRQHAIVDAGAGAVGASFTMKQWADAKPEGVLTSFTTSRSGVATQEYPLKQVEATKTMPASYGDLWRRTPTASGYASTLTSFSLSSANVLYDDGLYLPPSTPEVKIVEIYPYAQACSPFDASPLCQDYVKLYNPTASSITMTDLVLRTDSGSQNRTSSNTLSLGEVTIPAYGYQTVSRSGAQALALVNTSGYVWFEDKWGQLHYENSLTQYGNMAAVKQGSAWMLSSDGGWDWTLTPQPTGANVMTKDVKPAPTVSECPAGKYRNPETNRCRTIEEAVNALAVCPEGQTRHAQTNRCRSNSTHSKAAVTPCKEGHERNPLTNRCRSIASAVAALLPCDEGWERNAETRRCRKIKSASMPAAAYPVEPLKQAAESALVWWALGGVGLLAVGYAGWEWRREVAGFLQKIIGSMSGPKK